MCGGLSLSLPDGKCYPVVVLFAAGGFFVFRSKGCRKSVGIDITTTDTTDRSCNPGVTTMVGATVIMYNSSADIVLIDNVNIL